MLLLRFGVAKGATGASRYTLHYAARCTGEMLREGAAKNEYGSQGHSQGRSRSSPSSAVISSQLADRPQGAGLLCSSGGLHGHPSSTLAAGTLQGAVGKPFLHQPEQSRQTDAHECGARDASSQRCNSVFSQRLPLRQRVSCFPSFVCLP